MIALSQRTMANIRQNILLALGLKTVFLATTVLGITGLWPAILADTGATVLVTLNALRLLRPSKARPSARPRPHITSACAGGVVDR
jgi:Cd2+/Zn2+-exporting ATPase